jgi:hypothetical protein
MELGFELRASHLQSRPPTTWAMPPVHFAVVIFRGVCVGGSHELFPILPISGSQVAGITGVNHGCPAHLSFLKCEVYHENELVHTVLFMRIICVALWNCTLLRYTDWQVIHLSTRVTGFLVHLGFSETLYCSYHKLSSWWVSECLKLAMSSRKLDDSGT